MSGVPSYLLAPQWLAEASIQKTVSRYQKKKSGAAKKRRPCLHVWG
jgi:hypothetical protein